ncbi:hypothetical protein [Edwardsiella tarda]|uniref:hypothetical protein n=1 Tax=Edwardsiella tarda TaxID=636 RepID=UPI00063BEE5B|nr:hypothetical protein [Edwardsiella tarda]AKH89015.1 hypothetical protein AAW15_07630 [Edwardsiella tarda]
MDIINAHIVMLIIIDDVDLFIMVLCPVPGMDVKSILISGLLGAQQLLKMLLYTMVVLVTSICNDECLNSQILMGH